MGIVLKDIREEKDIIVLSKKLELDPSLVMNLL
jgi:hypothetical protein